MQNKNIPAWIGLICATALSSAGAAQAQANPEAGDVSAPSQSGGNFGAQFGAGAQASSQSQPQAAAQAQTQSSGPSSQPAAAAPSEDPATTSGPMLAGNDDHSAAVGHFGIGFFGVMSVPIMGCGMGFPPCNDDFTNSLPAPTIGLRYWLSDMLGIEGGLGLDISSGSVGAVDTSAFGLALHGGVPLALAHSGHFVFELVPMLNVGFASGSYKSTVAGITASTDVSGWMLEIGGKAGAEIHFGFMGLPQLSLQGTLGLMLRHESRSAKTPVGATSTTFDQSQTDFATGVDGSPWDIFRAAVAAIYYFY